MDYISVFDITHIRPIGRFRPERAQQMGALPLFWAASGMELCFTGSELHLIVEADFDRFEPWIAVELNGAPLLRMPLERGVQEITLFRGMTPDAPKHVRVFKETQPIKDDSSHRLWVRGPVWGDGAFLPLAEPACRLEFVGDSLTSGEGVIGALTETDWVPSLFSASRTWAKLTADLMNADFRLISQSGWGVRSGWDNDPGCTLPSIYDRVCAPASGANDLAMGSQLINDFSVWTPNAIIINLGTNDAGAMDNPPWCGSDGRVFQQNREPEGLAQFEDAAVDFLKELRRHNPSAKLVWAYGMLGDPLRPQLEQAVERFRQEAGDQETYYLPLPAVTPETMGSRQHPGALCHQAAAQATAALLKRIL